MKPSLRGRFTWLSLPMGIIALLLGIRPFCVSIAKGSNAYDVVIMGGRVIDPESNLDGVRNIGILNGKIFEISQKHLQGKTTINAAGLVVAPGFIDLHQHGQNPFNYAVKAADGVTTALELEVGVADIDSWYAAREGKALINYGASVGHIPIRMALMHDPGALVPSGDAARRTATDAEIEEMKRQLGKGLQRGALAVGLGPAYTPAATSWEILEMFRVAAQYQASCHVHIRRFGPGGSGNVSGLEEVLAAAAITGAPLHIVHMQSTGGDDVVHELQMIAEAQAHGIDVTTEAYPYAKGMTRIEASGFDHKENEPDSYYASLLWPATGEYLTRDSFLRYHKMGGAVIVPGNTEENVHIAIVSPLTMIASDGGLFEEGKGHPRTAGTYARVLGQYVREEKSLTLMDALRKMTLMPAKRLEKRAPIFKDKGRIRVGADADITIFDPDRVIDKATYVAPALHSDGIRFVVVNGVVVLRYGHLIEGIFPGRAMRAPVQP
jgi:N-acyl-D-aspartate/D-glutamate deacylase